MSNYRKYDDQIKEMVIKSGNPSLFPELKIPRTTALYWIRSSKRKVKIKDVSYDDTLLSKIRTLEDELIKERAKIMFVKDMLFNIENKQKIYSSKRNKEKVVRSIIKYTKWLSINEMCCIIGMKSNTFHRYKIDVFGCEKIGFKKCKILSPNQLTFFEQEKIYNLVHDKNLEYLSIKGLQYYAFREGIVSCSYESWRKYAKEFKGDLKKKNKKKYKVGIRARRPNEIWHIDITEFRLKGGEKIYLQVIMDNFSRKIINWKFSKNKKEALSIATITKATKSSLPEILMSDGGGENSSHKVRALLQGSGITSLIAKKDTLFSNSMIERFFNVLKNRFLKKHKRYKISKLYKAVSRSIDTFNSAPLSVLDGAKPNELYSGSIDRKELVSQLKDKVYTAKLARSEVNRKCYRQICKLYEFDSVKK